MRNTIGRAARASALLLGLAGCSSDGPTAPAALALSSPAFQDGGVLPSRFACPAGYGAVAGDNASPPLAWRNEPRGTRSIAIVMDDPDAPDGAGGKATFTHWMTWGIAPGTLTLAAGRNGPFVGDNDLAPVAAALGLPQAVVQNYFGACPPKGTGTHHYVFHAYALGDAPALASGASRAAFDAAIAGRVLAQATITTTVDSGAP